MIINVIRVSIPEWYNSEVQGNPIAVFFPEVSIPEWYNSELRQFSITLIVFAVSIPEWYNSEQIVGLE